MWPLLLVLVVKAVPVDLQGPLVLRAVLLVPPVVVPPVPQAARVARAGRVPRVAMVVRVARVVVLVVVRVARLAKEAKVVMEEPLVKTVPVAMGLWWPLLL